MVMVSHPRECLSCHRTILLKVVKVVIFHVLYHIKNFFKDLSAALRSGVIN